MSSICLIMANACFTNLNEYITVSLWELAIDLLAQTVEKISS